MRHRTYTLLAALVFVVAGCSTSTTVNQSDDSSADAAAATAEPAATATPAPEPTPEPEPTAEPDPTATPEPEPTEAPEAAAGDTDAGSDLDTAADRLVEQFDQELTGDEMACLFSALGDDAELAAAAMGDRFDDLPIEQRADLTTVMFECAPETTAASFSEALSGGAGTDLPPEISECLVDSMTTAPDKRDIIIGFVALGDEQPVPEPSQAPLIETMVTCFPGSALIEAGASDMVADPVFEEAMDLECLGDRLDGETMRPIWTALVENPGADFEELEPESIEPMMNGMFSCMSFGRVIAAEAAADGVELSEETVACIDTDLAELDFFQAMNDPAAQQDIGLAVLGCLSPEEAAQLN